MSDRSRVAVYLDFDNMVISRYDNLHGDGSWRRDNARDHASGGGDVAAERLAEAMVDVGAIIDPDSDRYLEHAVRTGPSWRNEFAPRLLLHPPVYLPGTAERVRAPLLVCVAEQDTETDPRRAARIARAAPRGEVVTYPVGHFAVYEDPVRSRVLEDQARFLVRHLRPGAEPAGGR